MKVKFSLDKTKSPTISYWYLSNDGERVYRIFPYDKHSMSIYKWTKDYISNVMPIVLGEHITAFELINVTNIEAHKGWWILDIWRDEKTKGQKITRKERTIIRGDRGKILPNCGMCTWFTEECCYLDGDREHEVVDVNHTHCCNKFNPKLPFKLTDFLEIEQ